MSYADEVREIQRRLRTLRAEAESVASKIREYPHAGHTTTSYLESGSAHAPLMARQVPSTDWHDDATLVERDQQLNHQVNQAVAEWMEAQRRCANSINSLYGGPHYAPHEFGSSTRNLDAGPTPWGDPEQANPTAADLFADFAHGTLDLLGLLTLIGEAADGVNAAWYSAEGDIVNAGLSAAGMIPLGGWFATGGKFAARGAKELGTTKAMRDLSALSPSDRRSVESYEALIEKHQSKLQEYRADPDKFDNKGILRNAPNEEVRQQIIDGRIKHLEKEIETFRSNIDKIFRGE